MVFGLVTAAGLGTRSGLDGLMRKELLPLYDAVQGKLVLRPVIDIVIRRLENAGCEKVVVVVDPYDSMTISYLEANFPACDLVYQEKKLGYGNAVYLGSRKCLGHDVLLNAGDGIVAKEAYYRELVESGESTLTLFQVDNPRSYGNAVISSDGKLVISVSEKPAAPISNLAIAATYYFKKNLLNYISAESTELTESIQKMVCNESVIPKIIPRDTWLSIGKKENYHKILTRSYEIVKKMVI